MTERNVTWRLVPNVEIRWVLTSTVNAANAGNYVVWHTSI